PMRNRRLSVEDVAIDEALPSYEEVIRGGPPCTIITATTVNSRYQTPSPRPGSSSQQYSSLLGPSVATSSTSPQRYSSLLGPAPTPAIVTSSSYATTTPRSSSPSARGKSPQPAQAPRSPQPKYSSLLPPAPGPSGPPPNYNITTSSLPEPPPSRKGKGRGKESRIQRWMFGETTSRAYHEGHLEKKYPSSKNGGVPLEHVVDRFGNRKWELKFETVWEKGMTVGWFVKAGVKYGRFGAGDMVFSQSEIRKL
ncbi:hypothetical protein L873DRAFT_1678752, partial [Choiromyces venosus 120613-1]